MRDIQLINYVQIKTQNKPSIIDLAEITMSLINIHKSEKEVQYKLKERNPRSNQQKH